MSVAIVDYGSGNLHSAAKAFERAARESGHDQAILVTRDPEAVRRADPGLLVELCRHGRRPVRDRDVRGGIEGRHLADEAARAEVPDARLVPSSDRRSDARRLPDFRL